VSKDLPQAACILLMFYDVFQENQGKFEEPIFDPEARIKYGAAISELREKVTEYYPSAGTGGEPDLFTICMFQLQKQFEQIKEAETKSGKRRGRPKEFPDHDCAIALNLYAKEYKECKDSKSAWEKAACLLNFDGKGQSLRKACGRYRKTLNPVNKGQN